MLQTVNMAADFHFTRWRLASPDIKQARCRCFLFSQHFNLMLINFHLNPKLGLKMSIKIMFLNDCTGNIAHLLELYLDKLNYTLNWSHRCINFTLCCALLLELYFCLTSFVPFFESVDLEVCCPETRMMVVCLFLYLVKFWLCLRRANDSYYAFSFRYIYIYNIWIG